MRIGHAEYFEQLESRTLLATIVWDGGAGTTIWNDPLNWDSDTVPTSEDDVEIPADDGTPIIFSNDGTARTLQSDRPMTLDRDRTLSIVDSAALNAEFKVRAGTLEGGSWSFGAQGRFRFANVGGRLEDVLVQGDLLFDSTAAQVTVAGDTRFGYARLAAGSTSLRLATGYTLRDTVRAEGTSGAARVVYLCMDGSGTNTLGPGASVSVHGSAVDLAVTGFRLGDNVTLVNQGTITGSAAGRTLTLGNGLDSLVNEGLVHASLGQLTIEVGTWTNTGTIRSSSAAAVSLDGSGLNSGVIEGDSGNLTLAGTWVNDGQILANQGVILLDGFWRSFGSISQTNASVQLAGNWLLDGPLSLRGGVLQLSGTFATAGLNLDQWSRTGGLVYLDGSLDNTGHELLLDTGIGRWYLRAGAIVGGSVRFEGGGLDYTGGLLDSVQILGDLSLDQDGERVRVRGQTRFDIARLAGPGCILEFDAGYTLLDPVSCEGSAGAFRTITVCAGGSGTNIIAPGVRVSVEPGTGGGLRFMAPSGASASLINRGEIDSNAGRDIEILASIDVFANEGTIDVAGGGLAIRAGSWSSPGQIAAQTARVDFTGSWSRSGTLSTLDCTVSLGGSFTTEGLNLPGWDRAGGTTELVGTLDNTGSAISLDQSTGGWSFPTGRLIGGTVVLVGQYGLDFSTNEQFGTLDGVTVVGDLLLDETNETVMVSGPTRFGTARLTGSGAMLRLAAGFVLHNAVEVDGPAVGARSIRLCADRSGTNTFAPGSSVTIRPGSGGGLEMAAENFIDSAVLLAEGEIAAEAPGQTLKIPNFVDSFTNTGTVRVIEGTIDIQPFRFENLSGGVITGGRWVVAGGILDTKGGGIASNAAVVELHAGGEWSQIGTLATNQGSLTLGAGRSFQTPGSLSNTGVIVLHPGAVLAPMGDFTQSQPGGLRILVQSADPLGGYGRIDAGGLLTLGGSLLIEYVDGYTPGEGHSLGLLTSSGGRAGEFALTQIPEPPAGDKSVLLYEGDSVRLLTTDLADLNLDGRTDTLDFLEYLNLWASDDSAADLDGDGLITTLDFLIYLNRFADG